MKIERSKHICILVLCGPHAKIRIEFIIRNVDSDFFSSQEQDIVPAPIQGTAIIQKIFLGHEIGILENQLNEGGGY